MHYDLDWVWVSVECWWSIEEMFYVVPNSSQTARLGVLNSLWKLVKCYHQHLFRMYSCEFRITSLRHSSLSIVFAEALSVLNCWQSLSNLDRLHLSRLLEVLLILTIKRGRVNNAMFFIRSVWELLSFCFLQIIRKCATEDSNVKDIETLSRPTFCELSEQAPPNGGNIFEYILSGIILTVICSPEINQLCALPKVHVWCSVYNTIVCDHD